MIRVNLFSCIKADADVFVAAIGLATCELADRMPADEAVLQAAAAALLDSCSRSFWTGEVADATKRASTAVNRLRPGAWPDIPARLSPAGHWQFDFSLPAMWGCAAIGAMAMADRGDRSPAVWRASGKLNAVAEARLRVLRRAASDDSYPGDHLPDLKEPCAGLLRALGGDQVALAMFGGAA